MEIGTLLMNTHTGGIGEIIDTRCLEDYDDLEYYRTAKEYHIYGRRTNREIWLKETSLKVFFDRGVLVVWPDELKPKEYIPRYDFQKG